MTAPLLEVQALTKHYGQVRAVDGVSFSLARGETLGLVGESGCGKSTLARLALRLIDPTIGAVRFDGADITTLAGAPLRRLRRHMQMVFQDPFASLNPRMTTGQILAEPLKVHGIGDRAARRARVQDLLALVGLDPSHTARYVHEFSGGQRQRIGIARALAAEPGLIVCDEPVSALDVSIQAQVVNLLMDLQARLGLSYLFIAHDLAVVRHIADRIAVMYLGRIVEIGPKDSLFTDPRHPYTRALMAAALEPDPHRTRAHIVATGEIPSPMAVPPGCRFHPRCPFATEICRLDDPALTAWQGGHATACHHAATVPPYVPEAAMPMTKAAVSRMALYTARTAPTRAPVAQKESVI